MVSEGNPDEKTLKQAFVLARKAYLLAPDDGTVADTLGWILYLAGRKKEALPQLERAAKLEPKSVAVLLHLAMAYMDSGDREKALAFLTKAKDASKASDGAQIKHIQQLIDKLNQ